MLHKLVQLYNTNMTLEKNVLTPGRIASSDLCSHEHTHAQMCMQDHEVVIILLTHYTMQPLYYRHPWVHTKCPD